MQIKIFLFWLEMEKYSIDKLDKLCITLCTMDTVNFKSLFFDNFSAFSLLVLNIFLIDQNMTND